MTASTKVRFIVNVWERIPEYGQRHILRIMELKDRCRVNAEYLRWEAWKDQRFEQEVRRCIEELERACGLI